MFDCSYYQQFFDGGLRHQHQQMCCSLFCSCYQINILCKWKKYYLNRNHGLFIYSWGEASILWPQSNVISPLYCCNGYLVKTVVANTHTYWFEHIIVGYDKWNKFCFRPFKLSFDPNKFRKKCHNISEK